MSQKLVNDIWYGRSPLRWLLAPLSGLFAVATALRRTLYRWGLRPVRDAGVPVVVVGNITVGGTGKTPLAAWLATALKARGHDPGIVTRGYGGEPGSKPVLAAVDSDPAFVGDEAILLARLAGCPVAVHPDRVAAARALAREGADLVVADDGMQHYRLGRQVEIAVVDGERGFGNGWLLPAGPLRELRSRLDRVDAIAVQCPEGFGGEHCVGAGDRPLVRFRLRPTALRSVSGDESRTLESLAGTRVHALAATGNPDRFFRALRHAGLQVDAHALRDHDPIRQRDLDEARGKPVVMTEKDAVKCVGLDTAGCWYLAVEVEFRDADGDRLINIIEQALREPQGEVS